MRYFNVIEDTRYVLRVSAVKSISEVGDSFVTDEEISERFGSVYISDYASRFVDYGLIKAELARLYQGFDDPKIRSIKIDDPELLEVMKEVGSDQLGPVCRRRDRLYRYKIRQRVQKAPSKSNINDLWYLVGRACRDQTGEWLPHIPLRLRTAGLMEFYKRATGWRRIAKFVSDPTQRKWIKMIWDNPKEYLP